VPLVSAYRYDGPEVNTRLAHSEAKILHEKIQHKAYSDDEIIRILTTRSKPQLLATFNYYNDAFGHPINKVHTYLINLCCSLLYKVIQEVTQLIIYNL
jgi:annexin D